MNKSPSQIEDRLYNLRLKGHSFKLGDEVYETTTLVNAQWLLDQTRNQTIADVEKLILAHINCRNYHGKKENIDITCLDYVLFEIKNLNTQPSNVSELSKASKGVLPKELVSSKTPCTHNLGYATHENKIMYNPETKFKAMTPEEVDAKYSRRGKE